MLTMQARALAGIIRRLIAASGLSVREIGRRIDRPHSSVSTWQHGQHVPGRDDVLKLLAVLEVPPAERDIILRLLRGTAEREPDGLTSHAAVAAAIVNVTHPDRETAQAIRLALESLAVWCDADSELCATTLDSQDLRRISWHLPLE